MLLVIHVFCKTKKKNKNITSSILLKNLEQLDSDIVDTTVNKFDND